MTDRKEDGLQALGAKTEYRMDMRLKCWRPLSTSTLATITGYVSTAQSSHPSALSQVSLTLQRFASAIFLM